MLFEKHVGSLELTCTWLRSVKDTGLKRHEGNQFSACQCLSLITKPAVTQHSVRPSVRLTRDAVAGECLSSCWLIISDRRVVGSCQSVSSKWNVKCWQEIVFLSVSLVWNESDRKLLCNKLLQHSFPDNCQIIYRRICVSECVPIVCTNAKPVKPAQRQEWPLVLVVWTAVFPFVKLSGVILCLRCGFNTNIICSHSSIVQ